VRIDWDRQYDCCQVCQVQRQSSQLTSKLRSISHDVSCKAAAHAHIAQINPDRHCKPGETSFLPACRKNLCLPWCALKHALQHVHSSQRCQQSNTIKKSCSKIPFESSHLKVKWTQHSAALQFAEHSPQSHVSTCAYTAGLKALIEESHISVASAEQGMAAAEGSLAEQDSPALGGSLGAAVGTPAAAVAGLVVGIPAV